jgi:hypothetical protein
MNGREPKRCVGWWEGACVVYKKQILINSKIEKVDNDPIAKISS